MQLSDQPPPFDPLLLVPCRYPSTYCRSGWIIIARYIVSIPLSQHHADQSLYQKLKSSFQTIPLQPLTPYPIKTWKHPIAILFGGPIASRIVSPTRQAGRLLIITVVLPSITTPGPCGGIGSGIGHI